MPRYGLFYYHSTMDIKVEQLKVLGRLLREGADMSYARHFGLNANMSYGEFSARIPLSQYSDLENWVGRVKNGEQNVLWPGTIRRFAVSSGTTGSGKHIPISDERLQSDLAFMRRVTRHILKDNPDPGLFLGKHVALSGSVETIGGIEYGEISGMLACASPRWIRSWQILCPEKSAYMPWSNRFEAIITNAMHSDVRMITGVPTWILILLREVSQRRGLPISRVWPNLRLIITGGVALSGYIDALKTELDDLRVRFLENYGASEGYYAYDWYENGSMLLQYDSSIFFEFVPIESVRCASTHISNDAAGVIPLWEVERHARYGLVVTNNSGLWRYVTNDEVIIESVNPPRICVSGRLNEMTDNYGEAVTASDVNAVLQRVMPDIPFNHIHIRPSWEGTPPLPFHEWMFVVAEAAPSQSLHDISSNIAHDIDRQLQLINRHYAIRRDTQAMRSPTVRIIGTDAYDTMIRSLPNSQSKLGLFIK